MAFFTCKLKSQALMSTTQVRLYFPCDLVDRWKGQPPRAVFTLLHGYTNDGDDWVNMSAALRYAADNNIALVIPDAGNSFYHDTASNQAYHTWLTEEMPLLLDQIVKLPHEREKNFICGLSMGGYGALMLALNHPERYAGCASFSGAVAMHLMLGQKDNPLVRYVFEPVYGQALELPENRDLFRLVQKVSALPAEQQPKILCTTGRQDHEPYYIYEQNQAFRQLAQSLPVEYTYMDWDGGHEWAFWDRSLVYAIDRFVNPGYADQILKGWSSEAFTTERG